MLEQLVFPCRAGCVDGARTCNDTAHSAAVTCAEQGCDTQIQAARTACQPDVASTACQTARTALVQCTQPCVDTAQSAGGACRTTLETCLTSCGNS